MRNMEKMLDEKESTYKILNNGRVVLDEGDYIRKVYFNKEVFDDVESTIEIGKKIHPDLFINQGKGKYFWVRMKKIEYDTSYTRDYETNVKNYLRLRDYHDDKCKRDLSPKNIIYQKSDGKFYLIDWDQSTTMSDMKTYYKRELTSNKWQEIYGSYDELAEKFERLW